MNVVEASGLGKRYARTWALRDCTLQIPAGRVTALVGPNGAGKTTLLNLAVGLTAPSRCPRPGQPGRTGHGLPARNHAGGDAMTTRTMTALPGEDAAAPRPLPWRRMAGVTWRQHRVTLAGVAVLLGGLAGWLWHAGTSLHHAYAAAVACHPASSPGCQNLVNTFNQGAPPNAVRA